MYSKLVSEPIRNTIPKYALREGENKSHSIIPFWKSIPSKYAIPVPSEIHVDNFESNSFTSAEPNVFQFLDEKSTFVVAFWAKQKFVLIIRNKIVIDLYFILFLFLKLDFSQFYLENN